MKDFIEFLESTLMTVIGGIFLVFSPILTVAEIKLFIDPAWVAIVISGTPILYSAVKKLIQNRGISRISSSLLISVAMIAAASIGDVFAAGEVAFIMAVGEMLEHKTTAKAKKGLKSLIELSYLTGRVIENGKEKMISAKEIKVSDVLRIFPGETIPADAEIIKGETSVDQSAITGESLPVDKGVGDSVFCGTINCFGAIDVRATRAGEDSSLQKLIQMVKEADDKKAPMQRIADRWASFLVPVAFLIAVIAYIVTGDITRAVTVLVVFCPCALVLATPTAIMAAIGQATKHGIVIKSGEALEKMSKADIVAFDKTGTLTYGTLKVSDVASFSEKYGEKELLYYTASAEAKSEHPLGRAITAYTAERNIELGESDNFSMEAGRGICADISGVKILCGNERYLSEKNIEVTEEMSKALDNLRRQGKALVIVAADEECIGVIALSDTLKYNARDTVSKLLKMRVDSVLLTGDNRYAAEYFAKDAGVSSVYAELLPKQKAEMVEKMQKGGKTVCMAGDGINDAPALKIADIGIAMGSIGSDIAVEAADIALMSDDISRISYLKRLSRSTVKTIKFSISLSLLINFAAIILSLSGLLTPVTGALVHNAGACFVVLIAALLYDRKFE